MHAYPSHQIGPKYLMRHPSTALQS